MTSPIRSNTEPYEPHPPDTYIVDGAICTLGKLPRTTENTTAAQDAHIPSLPPPPHSKRTIVLVTRTVNALLLQSACHLSLYSEATTTTDRPISLQDPLHPLLQALRKADQACGFARAWQRFDLVAKAHLFRGHAYRTIGLWDMAYEAYVRAASHREFAGDRSEEGLEAFTRYCAEMRDGKKSSERVTEAQGGTSKREVKGLFRCGTFGDLSQKTSTDAGLDVWEEQEDGMQLVEGVQDSLRILDDCGSKHKARDSMDGAVAADVDLADGKQQVDMDDELDWLSIVSADSQRRGYMKVRTAHPPAYPPSRSARGQLIMRKTVH